MFGSAWMTSSGKADGDKWLGCEGDDPEKEMAQG